MFNFNNIPTNISRSNSYPIFTIIEALDSYANLLSSVMKKFGVRFEHSPKIIRNHDNIKINPSFDQCSFGTKFLSNE